MASSSSHVTFAEPVVAAAASPSPSSSPSPDADTESSAQPLTAEQEAALDANPLERIYPNNKIEAPAPLAPMIGVLVKLMIIQEREDLADYAVEYLEHLKVARESDPHLDWDSFLSTQLKLLESKLSNHASYDLSQPFSPPPAFATMLQAFAKEVIRFQPSDRELIDFSLEYWREVSEENNSAENFRWKQTKKAEEKEKQMELEKKRALILKQKREKMAKGGKK